MRPSTSSHTTWTRSRPSLAGIRPKRRRPGQTGETPGSFRRFALLLFLFLFSPPLLSYWHLHRSAGSCSSPRHLFSPFLYAGFTASHPHLWKFLFSPIVPPHLFLASPSMLSGLRHTRSLYSADTCVMSSPELLSSLAFQQRNFLFSCFLDL